MMTAILMSLRTISSKVWGYVVAVGAVLAAIVAIYLKGKQDARNDVEREVMAEDLANRKRAEEVRRDVAADSGIADELRKWTRRP